MPVCRVAQYFSNRRVLGDVSQRPRVLCAFVVRPSEHHLALSILA